MNNPSFQHLNLSVKWICVSSLCGKFLGEIFQCDNGHVIDDAQYCDAKVQCEDGSDEKNQNFGFQSSGKSRKSICVLPQKNLYDSTPQCADSSDVCFVDGKFRCFLCLDEKIIISPKQVGDRNIDCFYGYDELLFSNQSVAQSLVNGGGSRCPPGQMHCNGSTECVAMEKVLCHFSIECKDQIHGKFCRHDQRSSGSMQCWATHATTYNSILVLATRCNNRPECRRMEDECRSQCDPRPSFCDDGCGKMGLNWLHGNRVCDGYINRVFYGSDKCSREVEENCSTKFPCRSEGMVSIDICYYCDGIFHCDDHSDETSIDCLKKWFNCTAAGDAISISKEFVCDGIKDCKQGEDEIRQLCGEKRFFCESGKPISVDKKFVQNGIKDCDTGLDECETLISDRYEMIANPLLRSLFWMMGFVALIENLTTSILTLKEMIFDHKSNTSLDKDNRFVKLANSFFIFNLTISDLLMGVHLLGVVCQGVNFQDITVLLIKNGDQTTVAGYLAQLQFYHQKHLLSSWHPCLPSDWSLFMNHSWPAPWNSNGSFLLEFYVCCFLFFSLFFHGFHWTLVILCLTFDFQIISSKLTQFSSMTSSPSLTRFLIQIPLFSLGSKSRKQF